MVNIYFVRHGQTDDNIVDILTGRNDISLNAVGIMQAENLKNKLNDIVFDKVYCSPLKRATQTAKTIIDDRECIIDARLIERSVGALEGFRFQDMDRKKYWNYYDCEGMYGSAESIRSIQYRVNRFIEEIKDYYKSFDMDVNVLVVSHHGISRLFRVYFDGLPEGGDLLHYGVKNGELRIFKLNI